MSVAEWRRCGFPRDAPRSACPHRLPSAWRRAPRRALVSRSRHSPWRCRRSRIHWDGPAPRGRSTSTRPARSCSALSQRAAGEATTPAAQMMVPASMRPLARSTPPRRSQSPAYGPHVDAHLDQRLRCISDRSSGSAGSTRGPASIRMICAVARIDAAEVHRQIVCARSPRSRLPSRRRSRRRR